MAKEKKRGFFSWLGFGQKEQTPEKETEVQNEQPVVEEIVQAQEPVKASEQAVEEQPQAHTEAEAETFAADVVEVTEQVAESEKAQPEAEVVAQPEPVVEETPEPVAIEREELPLPEDVNAEEVSPEEWQAEAETVEIVEAAVMVVPPTEEEQPVEEIAQEQEKPTKEGFFARLKRSLLKTKENLGSGFISLFRGKKIDDDLFEELEEQLLIADVGVETTRKIITNLTEGASRKQLRDAEALYGLLKEEMGEILAKVDEPLNVEGKTPFVILMVGVNGVGKTTTIGKLARQFEQQGKSVMLAAGDTFRAAAVEQLQVWGQRNNIPVIAQHTGADSASVIFDAIQAAKARNIDVLIADTAGRLQNKSHLMEELKKIVRVMKKLDVEAPHEVMLTIDASTGQNAVSQAKLFHEAVGLTGITLTKLDGTAKGGVIFSVADQFGIPIRYIGVGERIEDLRPFKADDFIEALFARED
ncbi:TPA: signal recognition particle-docking protein FtsY [Escherichia coli]|uniref:signal recognition particle-docking protein FtsY n=1 Tax=Escherichia coli TaxID=562 RepID=UPI0010CB889C|nr:signal recognition particle-docking protein FtsY [Escherichia coli]EEQ7980252.1 signal recognition particle-docking protein FtsY [Escherichia coli]EEQ8000375.1 signal recognition particle-docking protein FtsY [Escherichia coli]EEQ8120247.1 signal recognition particle-docking protein FtsY [Escherichia coli]EEQ8180249.1 signal recognition particle-docking protein FtsY [Escherichia coli]EGL7856096.1 signal recognition particle-docking protein FtsY [Escherichia coli]